MKSLLDFLAVGCIFVASATAAAEEVKPPITLELAINADEPSRPPGSIAGTMIIKNRGVDPVTVEHPRNRMASAFLLLNSLGNVVPPEGLAKVNQEVQKITIQPHSEYKHPFDRLEFLSGSGLFGYTLKPGEVYRVVAVYRPRGEKDEGIASPERTFTAK